ncbi:MAG: hypothetical protein U5P10_09295 [Spirochaetia bacterium]|nr:hypothetical protein [Spirochaetia bacterium]
MGIFDTVILDTPKVCRACGASIDSVQTKSFSPSLREYRVGDIVSGSPMLTGVIQEDLFCSSCNSVSQEVYFSIWHTLLAGVYDTAKEAEERLLNIDRAELMDYIVRHQKEAETWHVRFARLFGDLKNLYEYQRVNKSEDISDKDLRFFRIREILEAEDSFAALIEAHRPVNPEDESELNPAD